MELLLENLETAMLLTEHEVAEQLHVKRCTVRNERLRGHIGYVKVGYRYYYTQDQVDDYIRVGSVAPTRKLSEPQRTRNNLKVDTTDETMATARAAHNEAVSKLAQDIFRRRPRIIPHK